MRRVLASLLLHLALPLALAPPAAAAEPPPALIEATDEAVALCARLGGTPAILDGYRTTRDLNGDGTEDFLTDLGRLECGGAWSAFCGSSGCPVTAWLSAGAGFDRFEFGRLLGVAVRDAAPLPEVVARYAAASCEGAADGCTRTWRFETNAPETPPIDTAPRQVPVSAEPAPEPAPEAAPQPVAAAAPPPAEPLFAGWSLRRVPGASPVALGTGAGNVATLAGFCLSGDPFLALTFHERPAGDSVALRFAFSDGPVEAAAGFEPTAGGAFVVPLEGSPLAGRLAGRDTEVAVSVDGRPEGTLSLAGSTRALRSALGDCGGL